MSVKNDLLKLLEKSRGDYISGEQLAEKLGVSRAAIWKAIKSLKTGGYSISAVPNKGYSLAENTDILSEESIVKYLGDAASDLRISVYKVLPSTNKFARELAEEGEGEGKVIFAESQTNGHGRRGRDFFSPESTGIYMSLLLRPHFPAYQSLLLTTAAAVASARAIEDVSGKPAMIKWVNDVYMDNRKVCGILTEASLSLESGGLNYAVLGIGINVLPPKGGFPDSISNIAANVVDNVTGDVRSRLAAKVLTYFMEYYKDLTSKPFFDEYRRRLFFLGKKITILRGTSSTPATALDIDEDFHLLVQYEDGTKEYLSSGEISIKLQ